MDTSTASLTAPAPALTPGHKTTEFWLTIVSNLAPIIMVIAGVLPDRWGAGLLVLGNGLYALSRGFAKKATTTSAIAAACLLAAFTFGLSGCGSLTPAQAAGVASISSIGATIGAQVADSAVSNGIAKLASSITPGNPYLDSAANGLRTLQGQQFITGADIQTAIATFGDPHQPNRWKALGAQVAAIVQRYGGRVTADVALEASAVALQQLNAVVLPKAAA